LGHVSRTTEEKAEIFRALHAGEPFVIPNPWDVGSARALAALGFSALATTSSGFAFTLGRLDGGATLDEVVAHVTAVARGTDLPLSVDLEHGHGADPGLAIARVAEAGAVGASIEDWDGTRLFDLDEAVERVAAAVATARRVAFPFTLTARAENHLRGNPDLTDTIARLRAFAAAGADVLYAPGLRTLEEIAAVCRAVPKPVNVLAVRDLNFTELTAAGARRVSVGGSLAWAAVHGLVEAATAIRDRGDFSLLGASPPLQDWFASADGVRG
jgi:2-methylisocitrate lyase-like PEP mutase family enzyme